MRAMGFSSQVAFQARKAHEMGESLFALAKQKSFKDSSFEVSDFAFNETPEICSATVFNAARCLFNYLIAGIDRHTYDYCESNFKELGKDSRNGINLFWHGFSLQIGREKLSLALDIDSLFEGFCADLDPSCRFDFTPSSFFNSSFFVSAEFAEVQCWKSKNNKFYSCNDVLDYLKLPKPVLKYYDDVRQVWKSSSFDSENQLIHSLDPFCLARRMIREGSEHDPASQKRLAIAAIGYDTAVSQRTFLSLTGLDSFGHYYGPKDKILNESDYIRITRIVIDKIIENLRESLPHINSSEKDENLKSVVTPKKIMHAIALSLRSNISFIRSGLIYGPTSTLDSLDKEVGLKSRE